MTALRCAAVYARFSTDRQSHLSIDDQVRKCREYASAHGLTVRDEHIYSDEAMSGVGSDRPALKRMMDAALSVAQPFEAIVVDDTSRLSRSTEEALSLFRRLTFAGIQLVAVSQAIDSKNEQADVLLTVHGLVDSLYVKELAKKTHRGLEGKVLRGLHAGGRTYGYQTVAVEGGKRLAVNEAEAAIVRRIFTASADGAGLRTIARSLNSEGVSAPRPRRNRPGGGWCPTAIREMLRNERYVGRIVWNRNRFVKVPGTNRRVCRPRPESEWCTTPAEELRIVPNALWRRVQDRITWLTEKFSQGRPPGSMSRGAGSRYLLSGLLVCSECGAKLTIVNGQGKQGHARYGCGRAYSRGTCTNTLRERQDRLETRLLAGLQKQVLQPEVIDYTLAVFEEELARQMRGMCGQMDGLRGRQAKLQSEIEQFTRALADGYSPAISGAITAREKELSEITRRLVSGERGSIQAELSKMRAFVHSRLADIRKLLCGDVPRARMELERHMGQAVLRPTEFAGKRYYVAMGEWDFLGKETGPRDSAAPCAFEMVAGVGFEPTTFGL